MLWFNTDKDSAVAESLAMFSGNFIAALQGHGQALGTDLGPELENSEPETEPPLPGIDLSVEHQRTHDEIERTPEEQAALDAKLEWWKEWEANRPQAVQKLRRHSRALWKAMEGWQHVTTEKEWAEVSEAAIDRYKYGAFFLEQLGAERYLDPSLY